MPQDPVTDARDLIAELFPQARWAVLGGGILSAARTPGSDLDIVVVLRDNDPAAPHRDSRYWRGWPVELFVHDAATLDHYLRQDLPGRRPVLCRMVATGVLLTGDAEGAAEAARVQADCAAVLAAGPPAIGDSEHAYRRYVLTDLLNDLVHAQDPAERTTIGAVAWVRAAEEALAFGRHWLGSGKWLLRELRDMDAALADRWVAAHGDPDAVAAFIREVLDRAGGELFSGYYLVGTRSVD